MDAKQFQNITEAWLTLSRVVHVPDNDAEYQQLRAFHDELEELVGDDESHPLAGLMDVVGSLIESYDSGRVPIL